MKALAIAVLAAGCAAQHAPAPERPVAAATLAQLEASHDLDGAPIGTSESSATVVIVMASWCSHCRDELAVFDRIRARQPGVRWLAVDYKEHEEYDGRGNPEAMRALARTVPWLRVVLAGEELFTAVGRPAKIPTVLVFDHAGTLVERYERGERGPPDQRELEGVLARLR